MDQEMHIPFTVKRSTVAAMPANAHSPFKFLIEITNWCQQSTLPLSPFTCQKDKSAKRTKSEGAEGGEGERGNKGHTWALFLLLCRWPLEKVNGTRSAAIAIASSAGSGIRNPESEIRSPATHRCCTEKNYVLTGFRTGLNLPFLTIQFCNLKNIIKRFF